MKALGLYPTSAACGFAIFCINYPDDSVSNGECLPTAKYPVSNKYLIKFFLYSDFANFTCIKHFDATELAL